MNCRIAAFLFLCTISEVLPTLKPGAEWNLSGDQYSGLQWLDKSQAKPTLLEISSAISVCQANQATAINKLQDDQFQLNVATNTATQKLPALIDLLKQKGILQ